MRAPDFWFSPPRQPGLPARLLSPLASLYAAGTARRLRRGTPLRLPVPVVCIGNLDVGGTGKTPLTIALAQRLAARGVAAGIVLRGHGGRLTGPLRVDPARHGPAEVGDEALLLAAFAPVAIGRDRAAAGRLAATGADIVLMDDGHQNPLLAKDLSIVVVDSARGFGNGRVLPAGPLREDVTTGLARADLVVAVGDTAAQARFAAGWGPRVRPPTLRAHLAPLATGMDWAGLRVFAFAGIGRPQKFFDTLRGLGADIAGARGLDDHQPLTPALMARLAREAAALGAQLVTTEKDAVRLPTDMRGTVLTLPVRLDMEDWGPIDDALDRLLAGAGPPAV